MSSRFFRGGSESESESEESLTSDEELSDDLSEEESEDETERQPIAAGAKGRFIRGVVSDSDDSADEVKRVVKSAKDKKLEEIETSVRSIENAMKINDWAVISTEFDKLNKILAKGPVSPKEKDAKEKDAKKKMNAIQAKAMVTMKQKIRKNNRLYEDQIAKWREDTPESLFRRLREVLEARGKKNTDRLEQIKTLQKLLEFADTPYQSIRNIDPHTTDYVDRLKDETELYSTIVRGQIYFEQHGLDDGTSRVVMRRLEHLYYKPDQVIQTVESLVAEGLPDTLKSEITPPSVTNDSTDLIHALCVYLYKKGESLLRTRAMLCHIYHHALHNRFYTARDMLLMSHLQETIHQADVATQTLHNRTMVQVGLCAFREGMIKEAQSCLQDICGTGRTKELLAQGLQIQKYSQLSPEQEKLDRQRQLPFHMHINLELLECAYLTCSMLLEIPSMAAAGSNPEAKKKIISKPFRRLLDYNERQVFSGPPENTRDHIMGAAKALAAGEWQKCQELICAIKIWDLMPGTAKIKEMLCRKIQEEGLRTYLFTYSAYYSTIGLDQLATMFSLPVNAVTSIVSKMIWNEELAASLNQVNNVVVLHRVEPTKVQQLALMFAEKAVAFVEANERALEQKVQSGLVNRDQRPKGQSNQTRQNSEKHTAYQKGSGQQQRSRNNFNNVLGNSVRGRTQQSRYRA
ncbi:9758_t:CDS:10 [Paraglomus brasilianum]|uniref:Eukaryotic translation initiation factor 3 subunit C n=1 Tax=Paraglomus brasilianum TaxID=144538 RepID=A0A9N8VLN1_9GLOM|nr:9758_t:CDS:10 [Paraglomus brasilianum]